MIHRAVQSLLALTLATTAASATGADKCDDPEALRKWAELRDMRADDPGKPFVEELWALRATLCADVGHGRISQDAADQRFEAERERLYQRWRKALDEAPILGNEAA
jgi:hypothetical protein